ncbi:MAG: hypothetical protein NTY19_04920 [Planctomycetota bacterium]|nr:hypothetical protein [Planctomycetota bacterium]
MTTATRQHDDLDLDQAGDAFPVDTVVDVETTDNSGLIPAMAALLIDLYRKRLAREQAQREEHKEKEVKG